MPFQKGNKLGKSYKGVQGRKTKAEELGLQKLLDECWTEEERRECFKGLAAQCRPGKDFNLDAVKLLMAYVYGKPKERKEISGINGGDISHVVFYIPANNRDGNPAKQTDNQAE